MIWIPQHKPCSVHVRSASSSSSLGPLGYGPLIKREAFRAWWAGLLPQLSTSCRMLGGPYLIDMGPRWPVTFCHFRTDCTKMFEWWSSCTVRSLYVPRKSTKSSDRTHVLYNTWRLSAGDEVEGRLYCSIQQSGLELERTQLVIHDIAQATITI